MLPSAPLDLLRGATMAMPVPAETPESDRVESRKARRCTVCAVRLSAYNPNPNCWRHTIGHPWRGPTAKPKY